MYTLLEHQPVIDVPYEKINDIAVALVKEGYGKVSEYGAQVKQAKIEVLNELKERIKTAIDTYWNSNGGGYYLAEDAIGDIDDLIEEVENEQKD
jgi:L-lactate utilization protein LutB